MTKTIDTALVGSRVRVPRGKDAGQIGTIQRGGGNRGRYTIKLDSGVMRHGFDHGWIVKNLLAEDREKLEAEDETHREELASRISVFKAEGEAMAREWDALVGKRVRLLQDVKQPTCKSGGSGRYTLIEAGEVGTLRCDAARVFTVELDDDTVVVLKQALRGGRFPYEGQAEAVVPNAAPPRGRRR